MNCKQADSTMNKKQQVRELNFIGYITTYTTTVMGTSSICLRMITINKPGEKLAILKSIKKVV